MSTPNDTLREIHERCKTRHHADPVRILNEEPACVGCLQWWPCADYVDALAALRILDEAEREHCSTRLNGAIPVWESHRVVPDPGGRVAPPPTTTTTTP